MSRKRASRPDHHQCVAKPRNRYERREISLPALSNRLTSTADPNVSVRRQPPARTYAIAIPAAMPEVSAVTPAGKMTATVAATVATPGKVTTTVTTTTVTTATVATTAVATTCLG